MNPAIADAFVIFLYVLIGLVIARAFMSWVPSMRESEFGRFIFRATEPLLEPIRRVLPTMGGFDFSPLIVIVLIQIMIVVVRQAAES
jgi:YggT family protein